MNERLIALEKQREELDAEIKAEKEKLDSADDAKAGAAFLLLLLLIGLGGGK